MILNLGDIKKLLINDSTPIFDWSKVFNGSITDTEEISNVISLDANGSGWGWLPFW